MSGAEFVFGSKPIDIDSGSGVTLTDDEGNDYLDFGASYACAPLGHSHPDVTDAVAEQAAELTYVQGSYPVDVRTSLYDRVAALAPGDCERAWLANSGTEANEAALKFARHATGRSKIVATMQAFHGRTMGALAATWKDEYKEGFGPLAGDVEFVPYGDFESMTDAVDEETAAVIVEPIQGEGGVNPAPEGYLGHVRDVTDEAGAAFIADEIQTGVGRTGDLWAVEGAGVTPDIVTAAKGIANGLPMGVTMVREWIAADAGNHGSTFSGGPVPCAAANATLETLVAEDLPGNAADVGASFRESLDALADETGAIRDVRGRGLMVGVEVKTGANPVIGQLAMNHGILALPAGRTVVRFLPPLTVTEEHTAQVVEALRDVL
ncbi:acetylornithine aminotransferase [Halarchaeum acidiphilum MH1-52-1]|uniref:Putative [LysW]-aminoadipate semialdehyde/glutamate semialdehyde transaminase n=1 Tax=Halarchaeum acidiphilum MH1-52-1 TaxID=1261545 RepID=U3AET0_9EURY|nr:aspartate aminotransferase family protein [Halarchaeum acidiphilum]GAD53283.1 acetylornithine aminotransferase [Halarchaeum acidiphilum MH1-52-1]